MPDCMKYDLYEDKEVAGTLLINHSKAFARFREGMTYQYRDKSILFQPTAYILKDETGADFAKIFTREPWLGEKQVHIQFTAENSSCRFTAGDVVRNRGPFNLIIEIFEGTESVFILNEYEHRIHTAVESSRPMAGIIEIPDKLEKDKIWGFLIAIQVYFWSMEPD